MKQVAIVGIQGVPAKYGGFETLVENIIGENCSPEVEYTVFCSRKDYSVYPEGDKGVKLRYIPWFHANGAQSTPYDILSMLHTLRGFDTVVILGVSGCIFLPVYRLLFRKRLVVNIDGLEHRRAKWGRFAKWFLRTSEAMAVRYADVVVADNKGIQDYVNVTYRKPSVLIAYGGDHVLREVSAERQEEILKEYGLTSGTYSISVCRIEPENNSHVILEAFADMPGKQLVFIGNWNRSEYSRSLRDKYGGKKNIILPDSIYDLDVLYTLRNHCKQYIHGHSAGGTNPSLVEAMHFGKPILAYDVVYNRETTEGKAHYFKTKEDIVRFLLLKEGKDGHSMAEIAQRRYRWKLVAKQYEELY